MLYCIDREWKGQSDRYMAVAFVNVILSSWSNISTVRASAVIVETGWNELGDWAGWFTVVRHVCEFPVMAESGKSKQNQHRNVSDQAILLIANGKWELASDENKSPSSQLSNGSDQNQQTETSHQCRCQAHSFITLIVKSISVYLLSWNEMMTILYSC